MSPPTNFFQIVKPSDIDIALRRLFQPSAEEKMREALNSLTAQMEDATKPENVLRRANARKQERLRIKKERLEIRLEKLRALKQYSSGFIVGSLFVGALIWIVLMAILGSGAAAGGAALFPAYTPSDAVSQGLQKDRETIEKNKSEGLTVAELSEAINVGQTLGLPGDGVTTDGSWEKIDGSYPQPQFTAEVTEWSPNPESCVGFSDLMTRELPSGCVAGATLTLTDLEDRDMGLKCLYLQLGNESGPSPTANRNEQQEFARNARFKEIPETTERIAYFQTQDPNNGWDETMFMLCQGFGSATEADVARMGYSVALMSIQIDAHFWYAGGILTWNESDGSNAPRSQWNGHR